ncbi:MAG: thioredoxin domain-containing protein [Patescibacteria group bacterium]|nr:thioredoxin domain-containing protein [Patescibacteria group bacterium]
MSKQNKIFLIIAIAIVAVGFIFITRNNQTTQNNQTAKPVDQTDHVWGNPNAPVAMIVYSDFECPFCVKFSETMKQVEENFKDKVAITFRHYPLAGHPDAEKAAEASECAAEQGKFWEMHDKLFADNQAGRLSEEQFKQDAIDLGLNQEQFNQCLTGGKYKDKISQQKAEGDKAGATGTPTIFVNNNIYPGAYPFEDFISPDGRSNKGMKSIISELLK